MRRSLSKINQDLGIELWTSVADSLNAIIRDSGEIQINNDSIWKGILHKWSNEDWALVCDVMFAVMETEPQYFKSFHERALLTAETILTTKYQQHDRILDTKKYKKDAWRLLMTMREVYNAINSIDLPNANTSKRRLDSAEDIRERLFEY
jgi:hypothetical protein